MTIKQRFDIIFLSRVVMFSFFVEVVYQPILTISLFEMVGGAPCGTLETLILFESLVHKINNNNNNNLFTP